MGANIWGKLPPHWKRRLGPIFLILQTGLLSIGDPFAWFGGTFVFWILGLIATYLHWHFTQRHKTEIETLQQEIVKLNAIISEHEEVQQEHVKRYGAAFRDVLVEIGKECGLDRDDRVSVYKARENLSEFVLLGRYSPNVVYERPGRGTYPINRGLIAEASESSGPPYEDLPDPHPQKAQYSRWHKDHGL